MVTRVDVLSVVCSGAFAKPMWWNGVGSCFAPFETADYAWQCVAWHSTLDCQCDVPAVITDEKVVAVPPTLLGVAPTAGTGKANLLRAAIVGTITCTSATALCF
jgi:hypothetical protein